jgi:hypothetical protein
MMDEHDQSSKRNRSALVAQAAWCAGSVCSGRPHMLGRALPESFS